MKMIKIIFATSLCMFALQLSAQELYTNYAIDAVNFSQSTNSGTARFIGLGGANTSLGGDVSSISGNPAGLGFYNKSAWSISPVLRVGNYSALYEGTNNSSIGANVQIPNGAMVFNKRFEEYAGSNWISGTFGIGWNQKTSFFNSIDYEGTVEPDANGIINDFTEFTIQPFLANDGGLFLYPSESAIEPDFAANPYSDLASLVGLLEIFDVEDVNGNYLGSEVDRYDYADNGGYLTSSATQRESVIRTGGVTTLDLSYGANYNDILYIGAGLNINLLNFVETRTFREIPNNDILNFSELEDRREISGVGAGVTVGAIYKPINSVNIGVSYTSPTFISMTEIQNISLTAVFVDGTSSAEIINEVPNYSFVIPQKVSVGGTFFINKYGFVTADVEMIDYASARYNSNSGAFEGGNPDVSNELGNAINLKLGAEARLGVLRARAGYAYFDNPYAIGNFTQNRDVISGGLGILKNGFSADLTYSLDSFNNPAITGYPGGGIIESDSRISSFRLTLGKAF
jgi:hypothetical protein